MLDKVAKTSSYKGLCSTSECCDSSFTSGDQLIHLFLGKKFAVELANITINDVGVRMTTSAVRQFDDSSRALRVRTRSNSSITSVSEFQANKNVLEMLRQIYLQTFLMAEEMTDGSYQFTSLEPVNWHGGLKFPSNTPFCGYLGTASACSLSGTY